MKRIIFGCTISVIAVIVYAVVALGQGGKASDTPPKLGSSALPTVNRFVMMPAPSSYENFVWVIDSQTGAMKAYRFVQYKDADGAMVGFRIQEVPSL
jgi:hypothetical protein